ncbi:fluoride efflux transporter FluC [Arthrobacter sp. H14]|uniref:fluoride efflux transporter FluC n=1 Tax=Arthrobacter sp. H14 TaxID=1312959 RepID=UPI000479A1F4|nr:CrcB family protein [Arthrobacter sp. H14]
MIIVFMALAGGLGAGARFVVDGVVRSRFRTALPLGTILINVSGSLLLGLLAGLAVSSTVPAGLETVVGVGFLGGYTTFSTANVETVRLIQNHRPVLALINTLGTMLVTVPAAAAGLWLAQLA